MASKISLYIAIFLYLLSLCIPAIDDTLGINVIWMAILEHIVLIGIPFAFPVWANLSFYFAIKHYYKYLKLKDSTNFQSGAALALLTLILMFLGVMIRFNKLNTGALVWLVSGVFLLLAFLLKKLKPWLANLFLFLIVILSLFAANHIYQKERDISKHQLVQYKGLQHYLFKEKEMDDPVPALVQVVQNHAKRLKATGKPKLRIDKKAIDLVMLQGERIEIDFDDVIYPKLTQDQKVVCQLQPHQQFPLHYPKRYWEEGYEWRRWDYPREYAIGEPQPNLSSIVYRSKRIDEQHSAVQLIRKSDHKILYEQKLLAYPYDKGCRYAPELYASELQSVFDLLFDDMPPFEEDLAASKAIPEFNETLIPNCSWEKEKPNQYIFEGRKIRFTSEEMIEPQMLCSKHYVAVGYMHREANKYTDKGEFKLYLFQRSTLKDVLCHVTKYEMSLSQQQAYKKGEFKLERLVLKDSTQSKFCRQVEAHFSDKTVQIED